MTLTLTTGWDSSLPYDDFLREKVAFDRSFGFDIVDRLIERYSMPGELVFDPFSGLGTVALRARRAGRQGYGVELNPTSHRDALMYQREEDRRAQLPSLFDVLDVMTEGEAA